MKRNPKLAHEVTKETEVMSKRGTAIDSLTALVIASTGLARNNDKIDPVKELEIEEKIYSLLQESSYDMYQYLKFKKARYEEKLHVKEDEQFHAIEAGNEKIKQHVKDLKDLADQRGVTL